MQLPRLNTHEMVLTLLLWMAAASALASGPGPNGVNIGFDFNWNNGPAGYTASFIASSTSSGATLNNCGGAVNSSTSACNFVFSYSIGGVAQTAVAPGGVYETYPTLPTPPFCDTNPSNSAPLTLFNCFNANSFGQVFMASATGTLSAFTMPMTCLNPTGLPPAGLYAVLYQVNPNGISIPSAPLAAVPLDLSTCPTLTSWSGHVFSSADFAPIPMNFPGVALTAGNFYGVFFTGLAPGVPLPGSPTVTSVSPVSGALAGGNVVTLTGTGFTGATTVTFGGVAAASFTVVNDTTITAIVPSGVTPGAVSVVVSTSVGSNTANTLYSYDVPPVVATPVPTLADWSMATLISALIAVGGWRLRRRVVV